MRQAAKPILNQKETNRALFVNVASAKSIIGYLQEVNTSPKHVSLEPPCVVAPYYMVPNYLITYWYFGMMMLTSTKKSFSALEIQRQLGHLYYEPIWYMLHKIRHSMGKRDDNYLLGNQVELDEGFFEIVPNKERRDQIAIALENNNGKYKRGKGSQKQAIVLVMAESIMVKPTQKYRHKPAKKVRYIKMKLLNDLSKETTNKQVEQTIDTKASATTDGANNYNDLVNNLKDHNAVVIIDKKETSKILPWVHIAISNAKRLLLDVHHSIGEEYLQSYLDEFCYKFNRKYFNSVFDRVVTNSVSCKWKTNM